MTTTNTTSRKFTKKTLGLILSLVFILGTVFCVPLSASASSTVSTRNQITYADPNLTNESVYGTIEISDFVKGVTKASQVKNVKVSSSEIYYKVTDNAYTVKDGPVILLRAIPSFRGTAKISFQVGKKTYSTNFTVKNYVNPAVTFKVGSKNYKQQANYTDLIRGMSDGNHIYIKAKTGWAVTNVSTYSRTAVLSSRTMYAKVVNMSVNSISHIGVTFTNQKDGSQITLHYYNGK